MGHTGLESVAAGGGELGAAEAAETVERCDAVERGEALLAAVAVEARIGERRQRALPLGEEIEELGALQHALRRQYLAGIEPGEGGAERGGCHLLGVEIAGRR